MTTHRYWRVYCRLNSGNGSFTGLTEVEMATSAAGADVTSTTFAIGSGSYQAGSVTTAFNNDFTGDVVQWNGTGAGQYVGQDFGAGNEQDIVEVRIRPNKDAANRTFGEIDIQYSDDGSTWTTSWSITQTSWSVGTTQTFNPPSAAAHRYWRIRPLRAFNGNLSGFGIAEVEMRETVGGSDATGSGTASARTAFAGAGAANAFDNSGATIYSHNTAVTESDWLQYDFGSGVTKSIVEVTLLPRADNSWAQAPTTAVVESSTNAISWLERFRFTRMVGGELYTMRCIAPASLSPPGSGHRFWGLKVNTVQSGTTFGTAEVELRATIGGATITSGGAGAAKEPLSASASNQPNLAFDANTSNEYSSNNTLPDILAYDFGIGSEKVTPAEIKIRARSSTNNVQSPTAFDLVYSDDGQNWTVQESFTSPGTWTASEERLFAPSTWVPKIIVC